MFIFAHTMTPHRHAVATIINITPTASMAAPAPRRDNMIVLCCAGFGVPPRQLGCTVTNGKDWDFSFGVAEHAVVEVGQVAVGISSAVVEMLLFTADE